MAYGLPFCRDMSVSLDTVEEWKQQRTGQKKDQETARVTHCPQLTLQSSTHFLPGQEGHTHSKVT